MISKYTALWEVGRYMSRSKHFKDDWKARGGGTTKPSFSSSVSASVARMKVLTCDTQFMECVAGY